VSPSTAISWLETWCQNLIPLSARPLKKASRSAEPVTTASPSKVPSAVNSATSPGQSPVSTSLQ
jgi:hypothetical protein